MKFSGKIGAVSIGIPVYLTLGTWGFDYLLYPSVLVWLGPLWGGVVMTVLSAILCYLSFLFYDWSKQDWLGIEALKGLREGRGKSWFGKIFSWVFRKGDLAMLILLSIKVDPFVAVIYMRHGQGKYNGLSKRDWKIFIASFIISNLYWILSLSFLIGGAKWIWNHI